MRARFIVPWREVGFMFHYIFMSRLCADCLHTVQLRDVHSLLRLESTNIMFWAMSWTYWNEGLGHLLYIIDILDCQSYVVVGDLVADSSASHIHLE